MVSLDAKTGRRDADFGENGVVDLRKDFGPREVDIENDPLGSSSPPVIVGDVAGGGDRAPVRKFAPEARHAAGPRARVRCPAPASACGSSTPSPRRRVRQRYLLDGSWRYTGNAAVWTPFSADLERGYVYLPIEAPTGDYYGGHHPGDNLYSQSLVCLDARTG